MKIAILDLTGHPLPELEGLPTAGQLIVRWLAPAMPEAELRVISVAAGAALPDRTGYGGIVVSGSEKGVYDDTPWMAPLRDLLLDCRAAAFPVFGLCFGHQIMADVYGGKAEKAVCGKVVGVRTFDFDGVARDAVVWHQDQVTRLPPGARVTASADYCPCGALDYEFPARSVQFHPEYGEADMRDLFDRGRGWILGDEEARQALASFRGADLATDLAVREAADLFRRVA